MGFRTASEGFWTIFLIPIAIYLQDDVKYFKPVLMIITFQSLIISIFHGLKLDFQILLPKIQTANLVFSFLTLAFCIERGGKKIEYNVQYKYFSYYV